MCGATRQGSVHCYYARARTNLVPSESDVVVIVSLYSVNFNMFVCRKKNHLILAAALSHNENIVGVFYICVWILNFASDYAIAAPVTD